MTHSRLCRSAAASRSGGARDAAHGAFKTGSASSPSCALPIPCKCGPHDVQPLRGVGSCSGDRRSEPGTAPDVRINNSYTCSLRRVYLGTLYWGLNRSGTDG